VVFQEKTFLVHPELAIVQADAFQEVATNPSLGAFL
jgi:hypothetical protein